MPKGEKVLRFALAANPRMSTKKCSTLFGVSAPTVTRWREILEGELRAVRGLPREGQIEYFEFWWGATPTGAAKILDTWLGE